MGTKQNTEPVSQMIIFVANLPSSLMIPLQQTSTLIPEHRLRHLAIYRCESSLQLGFLDATIPRGRNARTTLSSLCHYY